jgi:hypothetical protein
LLGDGGNDGSIATSGRTHPRRSGQNDAIPNAEMRIIRKPLIDGDRNPRTARRLFRLCTPNRRSTHRDQSRDHPPASEHARKVTTVFGCFSLLSPFSF